MLLSLSSPPPLLPLVLCIIYMHSDVQDGASLIRALLSEEAAPARQQFCRTIADVLYCWMVTALGKDVHVATFSQSFTASDNYMLLLTDRRLKVVVGKVLNDARRDWALMLRFLWASLVMLLVPFAMACHRFLVSSYDTHIGRISFPIDVAIST